METKKDGAVSFNQDQRPASPRGDNSENTSYSPSAPAASNTKSDVGKAAKMDDKGNPVYEKNSDHPNYEEPKAEKAPSKKKN